MSTLAILCVGFAAGCVAAGFAGFYFGCEYTEARPAPENEMYVIVHDNEGNQIHSAFWMQTIKGLEGKEQEFIIQSN